MPENNINLVRDIYDKFNNRNYEAVLANFGENFEWVAADSSPLADRSPYHGIEAVREGVFARIEAGFERLVVDIDEVIDAGDKIVVLGYYNGLYRGSPKPFRSQLAHIWTIADGKAVKFQQYVDTYQIAQNIKAATHASE
jgi:hypothetical protein